MIWARASRAEAQGENGNWRSLFGFAGRPRLDERRVRDFLLNEPSCSESVDSLARKLRLSRRNCRKALELLVREGLVRRRDFADIEPIYYRYPDFAEH